MKIIFTLCFLWIITDLRGQSDSSGIFMTARDYLNGKLTLPVRCDDSNDQIKLNSFLNKPYISVTYEGKKQNFYKAEIFGFRDCTTTTFRFYSESIYKVLNDKAIFIYQEASVRSKSTELEIYYFFSKTADDRIFPLTIQALKQAFPKNYYFHDELDALFKSDDDLLRMDHGTRNYTLIRLYNKSTSH